MNSYSDFETIFKALADVNRLKIVSMLSNGEMCACKILEQFDFSQPALSQHMKVLCRSGLVSGVRDGAWMHYTLNNEKLKQLMQFITLISNNKTDNIEHDLAAKVCSRQ
jgi:ArsR family transcriptional regulator, arsenate/arsenite/antimonite-responsive transcriptional repressor